MFLLTYILLEQRVGQLIILAATKQLYEWFSPPVCLSVRLSVRLFVTPFSLCPHHSIITILSWVITNVKRDVHAKGQGQRSKVKVTEFKTPFSRFRTVTTVWIHIWRWNHAYSLMLLRRGALLFCKVTRQISRSYDWKIIDFDPNWAFPDCNSSLNSPMAMKWCTKLEAASERYPIVFQGHPSNFKVIRDKKLLILTRIERFRTVTPVWIHRWIWNDAQSLM